MMTVHINGKPFSTLNAVLADIVAEFGATPPFALAVNGDFIPKAQAATFTVQPDDKLDIVSPVVGG